MLKAKKVLKSYSNEALSSLQSVSYQSVTQVTTSLSGRLTGGSLIVCG